MVRPVAKNAVRGRSFLYFLPGKSTGTVPCGHTKTAIMDIKTTRVNYFRSARRVSDEYPMPPDSARIAGATLHTVKKMQHWCLLAKLGLVCVYRTRVDLGGSS